MKLILQNSSTAELILQNGVYLPEGIDGSSEFTNQGKITQSDADVKVNNLSATFNAGTWISEGALTLPEYTGANLGNLEVRGILNVTTHLDALKALEGLKSLKAAKLIMHAKGVDDSASCATLALYLG